MSPAAHGLVAPSDIAEMAGVSRAAVSNWRKRASDFPAQAGGTTAKPLFDRAEVIAWLRARGKEPRTDRGELAVWAALNEIRGRIPADTLANVVMTLACIRKLSTQSAGTTTPPWQAALNAPAGAEIQALVDSLNQQLGAEWLRLAHPLRLPLDLPSGPARRILAAIDAVEIHDLGDVVDFALSRTAAAQMRLAGDFGIVDSKVSQLLGRLAATQNTGVLYDPACGLGAAIIEAVRQGFQPGRVVGHDVNVLATRQFRQRAYLNGVDVEVKTSDVLMADPDPDLLADVIVVEPPFGLRWDSASLADPRWRFGLPPRSCADLAWVQHTVAHLTDAGRGYVVTPMGPLFRGSQEQAIRSGLLQAGCIEAVIALPGKLLPHTSIPLALWVLRSPHDNTEHDDAVLLIDGTQCPDIEVAAPAWLQQGRPDDVSVPSRLVPTSELLAAEGDLVPQRWIEVEPDADVVNAYFTGWRGMTQALHDIAGAGASLRQLAAVPPARVLTIGELIDQGVLELRTGKRYDPTPREIAERVVTAADVRDGKIVFPEDETSDLLDAYPELTRDGDVLVTTMNQIRALVDEYGGHLAGTGVYRLRVTNHEQLSTEFLAQALQGSWNQRFQAGSTIQRAPIKSLEIPVIPIDAQRHFRLAVVAVRLIQEDARDLLTNAQAVERSMLEALRYNVQLAEPSDGAPGT